MRRPFLIVLLVIAACGSNSAFEERFVESQDLSAPPISVSLSDPNQFTFAMVGDTHVGGADTSRLRRILQAAKDEGDSFVVLLGDIVDAGETSDIDAVKKALSDLGFGNKYLSVIGNHDVFNDGWNNFKNAWGASHYSVDLGNSRFIAMDTADGTVGADQFDWVKSQLEKPQPKNTFLLSHYLPVVPGQRTYLRLANELEAERLMKLASSHGVKGWFGGHYHSYCNQTIRGVTYVVAGGGGGRRMEPVKDFFFIQVTVSSDQVTYQIHTVN